MEKIVIVPGKGIEGLSFGTKKEHVQKIMGVPEEEEMIGEEGFPDTLIWYYSDKRISLFFEDEKNEVFSCMEVCDDTALLWGEKVFTLDETSLIKLFKTNGFTDIDTEQHEWGEKRISFEDALVDMYFEEGYLTSINFGMVLSDPNLVIYPN